MRTLDRLKRAARAAAEANGHRLGRFRRKGMGPVARCSCGDGVQVQHAVASIGSLWRLAGYALERPCPGRRKGGRR